jgi:hypothetical protein
MLSLLKKNPGKAKTQQAPAWHTNFRNVATLPDTKLIRTSFYINGALILAAGATLLAVVYQEMKLSDLSTQLEGLQQQIQRNAPASNRAIAQYKKFQVEEQKIIEIDGFLKAQKVCYSDLIIHLAQSKPQVVTLLGISYDGNGVNIKGYAQGISEQATGAASSYEKQLKEDPAFSKVFKTITMTNVSRDTQANRLAFEISMSLSEAKGRGK